MVRFKNRYLLLELDFADEHIDPGLTARQLSLAVKEVIARVHGDYGLGCILQSLGGGFECGFLDFVFAYIYIYIYIYVCVCVCVYITIIVHTC